MLRTIILKNLAASILILFIVWIVSCVIIFVMVLKYVKGYYTEDNSRRVTVSEGSTGFPDLFDYAVYISEILGGLVGVAELLGFALLLFI